MFIREIKILGIVLEGKKQLILRFTHSGPFLRRKIPLFYGQINMVHHFFLCVCM